MDEINQEHIPSTQPQPSIKQVKTSIPNTYVGKDGSIYRKGNNGLSEIPLTTNSIIEYGQRISSTYPVLFFYNEGLEDFVVGNIEDDSLVLDRVEKDSINVEDYTMNPADYNLMLLIESQNQVSGSFLINGSIHRMLHNEWFLTSFREGTLRDYTTGLLKRNEVNSKQSFIKFILEQKNISISNKNLNSAELKQIVEESLNLYQDLFNLYNDSEYGPMPSLEFEWIINQFTKDISKSSKNISNNEDLIKIFKDSLPSYIDIYRTKKGFKVNDPEQSVSSKDAFKKLVLQEAEGKVRLADNELINVLSMEDYNSIMEILREYPDLVIGVDDSSVDDNTNKFTRGKFKFCLKGDELACSYSDFKAEAQEKDKLAQMLPIIKELLQKLPQNFFICYSGLNLKLIKKHGEVRMRFRKEMNSDSAYNPDAGYWYKVTGF